MIDTDKIFAQMASRYAPLSDDTKAALEQRFKLRSFEKQEHIIQAGQYADKLFYIVQGCARAYYLKDGKDISDWFAFENDFITPINSFFMAVPSPHYIEVMAPSLLLELSKADVEELSDTYRDFERLNRAVITDTLLKVQARVVSIQFQSAEEKYDNILALHPNILQDIPLTHIASYIGITLETLSRIRKSKHRI